MKGVVVASLIASTTLTACAGTLSQALNRPISSDKLDETGELNKLKTLSGDLRLVRTMALKRRTDADGLPAERAPYYDYAICAETQADAIITRSASSSLGLKRGESLQDAAGQGIQITNERSAVSDVVRQLAWNLCNARMNGYLADDQYQAALLALSHNSMVVLQQIAMGANAAVLPLNSTISGAIPAQAAVVLLQAAPAPKPAEKMAEKTVPASK